MSAQETMTAPPQEAKGGKKRTTKQKAVEQKPQTDFYSQIETSSRLRDEYIKNNKIPQEYRKLVENIHVEMKSYFKAASKYIPRMLELLTGAGIPKEDARLIVEADSKAIWANRTVILAMPAEYKNAARAESGSKGGAATAASTAQKAPESPGEQVASAAPETTEETDRRFTFDLSQYKAMLMRAIEKAEKNGSNTLFFEVDKNGFCTWVEAGHPENEHAATPEATAPAAS